MSRLYTIFFLLAIFISPALSEAQVITGPEVKLVNNDIYVSFSLTLEDKNLQEIKSGIDKELKINVDLFRVWKVWPDEFVLGKMSLRILKVDPIRNTHLPVGDLLLHRTTGRGG